MVQGMWAFYAKWAALGKDLVVLFRNREILQQSNFILKGSILPPSILAILKNLDVAEMAQLKTVDRGLIMSMEPIKYLPVAS